MAQTKEYDFISFDGGVKARGRSFSPEDRSELVVAADQLKSQGALIPRGAGLSFCASSFGEDVTAVPCAFLDKIEVLDRGAETVTVQPGIQVGRLLDFLVAHDLYLPVLPGYPTITIGGCMAADVHGKNQARDGSFIRQIERFTLHHVDHGEIEVSREKDGDLFDLTVGGCGLTGTILSVTLKVSDLRSRELDVVTEPLEDISVLAPLLERRSADSDFLITWHDFNQVGAKFGRGYVQSGTYRPVRYTWDLPPAGASQVVFPLRLEEVKQSPLTLTPQNRGAAMPPILSGLLATGLMNSVYDFMQKLKCGPAQSLPIEQCFFPNKSMRDLYFHAFGNEGLFEHQVIVSAENFPQYVEKVRWWLARNSLPMAIASSKFFKGEEKLLRFNGSGVCFALDFARCASAYRFLHYLDQLTVELQAIPNIFKDSRVPREVVESCYPQYAEFKQRLVDFDPKRRYQSELSRRLGL